MSDWNFFPSIETVFSDEARDFFIPLATVSLGSLCPGHQGPVHFLRPRMCNGDKTAKPLDSTIYPDNWYGFQRDQSGRYQTIVPLGGKPDMEPSDPYETGYCGNSRDRFRKGEIGPNDLLRYSDLSGQWPNANWNDGRTAYELVGRDLKYIGEIDTANFCKAGAAGSVLLLDEESDIVIQVFHWT
ncbi:hypothetical protein [Sulfitobacter sp. JB4-11]|uniref:hypothetical protein n=1 Tax=Sulfitobacter rhodophyticola TaxID=3238304 RepID=UPI0035136129